MLNDKAGNSEKGWSAFNARTGLPRRGGFMSMRRFLWASTCTLVLAMFLTACSGSQPLSTREEGTLGGGLLGAGTGAIIGAAVGHPGVGAAIGGGVGAVGGFAVGNAMQNQEVQQQQTQTQMEQQQQEIERQRRELEQMKQQQQTE
jgi:outer membrane lipoprotein SlyB